MSKYEKRTIKTISAGRAGKLSFFEAQRDIPFDIKRVYYIYGAEKDCIRGGHAHKELCQFIICMYGKIRFIINDGVNKYEVVLDSPEKGIYLEPGLWRDIIWETKDSVLCVMASEFYDESDYLRDYNEFLEWKNQRVSEMLSER